jgi:hypothetical protein
MKNSPVYKISPHQPTRILLIENSENDEPLIVRELKNRGDDPTHERMETFFAMKKAFDKTH